MYIQHIGHKKTYYTYKECTRITIYKETNESIYNNVEICTHVDAHYMNVNVYTYD